MKNKIILSVMLLLISENAFAGGEYDKCINEEKNLKVQEASNCKGLSYLLNPSGCFVTQKALKDYTAGKCKKIGITEKVDFSIQPVIPKKIIANETPLIQKKIEPEIAKQKNLTEQLKEENARLKAEIYDLRNENEQYRKQFGGSCK